MRRKNKNLSKAVIACSSFNAVGKGRKNASGVSSKNAIFVKIKAITKIKGYLIDFHNSVFSQCAKMCKK